MIIIPLVVTGVAVLLVLEGTDEQDQAKTMVGYTIGVLAGTVLGWMLP